MNVPTTLLAELTHRCPLHCPYCSNPLDLVRAEREISTEDWKRVITEARGARRAPARPVRRRAAGAEGHRGARRARAEPGPLQHARHLRPRAHPPARREVPRGRAGAHPDLAAGRRRRQRRADRRRALGEAEARGRGTGARARVRLLGERGAAQGQPRPHPADHRPRRARWAPTGSSWPTRSTTAGGWSTATRSCRRGSRWIAPSRSPSGRSRPIGARCRSSSCCRTTTRSIPKACYGGWGKVYLVVTPDGKVLPCHGATNITTHRVPERARAFDGVDLAGVAAVQCLPRRQLDEVALHAPASGSASTSAAAAARPSRSPATRPWPTRSAP